MPSSFSLSPISQNDISHHSILPSKQRKSTFRQNPQLNANPSADRFMRNNNEIKRAREVFRSKYRSIIPKTAKNSKSSPKWKVIANVRPIRPIIEDFYSTTLAACSSWFIPREEVDVPSVEDGLHGSGDTSIQHDEILCVDFTGIESWSRQTGFGRYWREIPGAPTCIAISQLGIRVAGYYCGSIAISSKHHQRIRAEKINEMQWKNNSEVLASQQFRLAHPTSFLILNPTAGYYQILVGDSLGRVLRILMRSSGMIVVDCIVFDTPSAICAMAASRNEKFIAITTSDQKIRVLINPKSDSLEAYPAISQHSCIEYGSVVRGLSFCPASPNILATGGGRHDRRIRFLRIDTSEFLFGISMPGQVVGIVWLSEWEVFVAIGHSRVHHYEGLGKVVNVVDRCITCDIPGEGYSLSAVKTIEGVCINTSRHRLICFTWKADSRLNEIRSQTVLNNNNPLSLQKPMPQLR